VVDIDQDDFVAAPDEKRTEKPSNGAAADNNYSHNIHLLQIIPG
jgi:hypothetical protein